MSQASTIPEYEAVLGSLARTIREHRENIPPYETARQLLEYDQPGHTALVGINYEASRAILYHEVDKYVIAVEFGPDGLGNGGPKIADFSFGRNIYSWVRNMEWWPIERGRADQLDPASDDKGLREDGGVHNKQGRR